MAEVNKETSQMAENNTSKNKLPLDQMSKEDLLKQVKRQLVLLQKAKSKSDEMTKRCAELENERDKLKSICDKDDNGSTVSLRTEITELESKLEKVKGERVELEIAYQSIQKSQDAQQEKVQNLEGLLLERETEKKSLLENLQRLQEEKDSFSRQCQSTAEQVECMKMKVDTLTMTCQCLQEEITKLQNENRELQGRIEILMEARDTALQQLHSLKEHLNSSQHIFVELEHTKQERDSFKQAYIELENKMSLDHENGSALTSRIEELIQENKSLAEEKEKIDSQWRQALKEHESWKLHLETCESEKEELCLQRQECSTLRKQVEELEISVKKTSEENKSLLERVQERSDEVHTFQSKMNSLSSEVGVVKEKNEELQSKIDTLVADKKKLQAIIDKVKDGDDEAAARLNEEVIRTSSLEMELSAVLQEKQDAVEKLYQLEELQQFMEDETRGLREENDKLKFETKRLEADLENDILHIRKLENELQEAEERERISYLELDKMKRKFHEIEKADHILKSKIKSEEANNADIQMMTAKCRDLEAEKEILIEQLDCLKQKLKHIELHQETTVDKNTASLELNPNVETEIQEGCPNAGNQLKNIKKTSNELPLDNTNNANLLQSYHITECTDVDKTFSESFQEILTQKICVMEDHLKIANKNELELKEALEKKSELVEKIHCQMDDLLAQIEQLNGELEEKSRDLNTAEKVLQEQQEIINDLKNLENGNDEKLSNLELEILKLKEENQSLTSDLELVTRADESDDGWTKASEILKLKKEKVELEFKIVDLNKCIQEKDNKIKNIIVDNEKLRLAEQAATEKVSCVRKQITAELEEQLNIKKMASERTEKEMVLDIQNLTLYLQEKKMQVNALGSENNLLTSEVNMLQMSIKSIEENFTSQIFELQQELNEKTDLALNLEQQNKLLQEHFEQLTSKLREYESSEQQVSVVENELRETQQMLEDIRLQNIQYSDELNILKGTLVPQFEEEINILKQQLEEKLTSIKNLEEEKNKLLEKISTFKNDDIQQNPEDKTSVENLQKTLKETEIKMAKFKALAIKVKRELAEANKQISFINETKEDLAKNLNVATSNSHQHLQNFKTLQSEYDRLQDEYESVKLAAKHLEQDLTSSSTELVNVKDQLENIRVERDHFKHLVELGNAEKKEAERTKTDLEGTIVCLQMKQEMEVKKKEEMKTEVQKSEKKCKDIEEQLRKVQEQHKVTCQQLEQALKDSKKHSLIELEMADYDRTISDLNDQLNLKNGEILELQDDLTQLKDQVTTLQEEMKHCESQRQSEESRADNLKEVLIKVRKELDAARNNEAELMKNESSLHAQLELLKQEEEGYKVQLSEAASKLQCLEDSLSTSKECHQRATRSLESKITNLEEQLNVAQHEIEINKQEFENYKVRVHSVLKQQKHSNPVSADKADQEMKDELEKAVEHLKLRIEELTEKLHVTKEENSILQDEHERLLQRHTMMVEELQAKEKIWSQRLDQLNSEKNKFQVEQEKLNYEHEHQTEKLKFTFKQQIQNLQTEYRTAVEELQKQLDAADKEIGRLQRERQKMGAPGVTPSSQEELPPFDIFSQERQAGEGSEFTEGTATPVKHLSLATIPTVGFTPLEQLLQFPDDSQTPVSVTSQNNSEEISASLTSAYKKIDHLSEVLNESEASNLHLEEQVRVLKEEIRRLERNKEREKHGENLEYLKNVVMKFVTLSGGSERERLIPILTTLLRLSPEEHNQLRLATGDSAAPVSSGAGWGNYLHRWSGFM